MSADVRGPVPLPERMPPSVVEPVPPILTATVVVPDTTPVAEVNKSEFLILEIVRLDVLAFVEKRFVVLNAVEEAKTNVDCPAMYEVEVLGSK